MTAVQGALGISDGGLGYLGLGGPLPDMSFALASMATTAQPYIAHLYDRNLIFKRTLGGAAIVGELYGEGMYGGGVYGGTQVPGLINKPGLKQTQNGGYQQVMLELSSTVAGIALGDVIRLTEQGDNAGTILFSGNIETTPEEIGPNGTHHQITVTPWVAELGDAYFNQTYAASVDVAQFVRDAVAQTAHCSVSPISCPDTGIKAQYDFVNSNALDAIHVAKQIAGANFFYHVDAQGVVWFQQAVTIRTPSTLGLIAKLQVGTVASQSGATITPTLPAPSTTGSCLVAFIGGSVVTSAPIGWFRMKQCIVVGYINLEVWVCLNAASVSSVAFNLIDSGITRAMLSEWSNVVSAFAKDASGIDLDVGGTATSLNPTTDANVNTQADVALAGWYITRSPAGTVTFTTPTGFTRVGDNGSTSATTHLDVEYEINPLTGSPFGTTLTCSNAGIAAAVIVCLKATGSAAVVMPPTITLKKGLDYNYARKTSTVNGQKNKIPVVGSLIFSLYDGAQNQLLYGVRAFNPTPSYPNVIDQATLDAIAESLGSQYDRVLFNAELELPALGQRLILGRPGGVTVRLLEESVDPMQESAVGSGGYTDTFIVQDVETNGPSQHIVVGNIPFTDLDPTYEATRIAQRTSVVAAGTGPTPVLNPQPTAPTTTVYGLCRSVTGLRPIGGGIVTVASATFTTPTTGTCQVVGAIDARMEAWSNFVATPRRAVRATLSGGIYTGAWQELPFSLKRDTYDLSSASGIALAAGTYTVKIEIDTQQLNRMRIFSGYVQVAVTA